MNNWDRALNPKLRACMIGIAKKYKYGSVHDIEDAIQFGTIYLKSLFDRGLSEKEAMRLVYSRIKCTMCAERLQSNPDGDIADTN